MIDQRQINLLTLIGGNYKKVAATNGGEYHGPCPFCGGKDRFVVWPDGDNGGSWWCRQCGRGGDAIAFIMARDGLDFKAACNQLSIAPPPSLSHMPAPPLFHSVEVGDGKPREEYACFSPEWQRAAWSFAYDCAGELWEHWQTSRAARYLEQRGIDLNTAIAHLIGVNPAQYRARWDEIEVSLPRGITIPWVIDGPTIWNIRVRRPNADLDSAGDKYMSTKGAANGLYQAVMIAPGKKIVMTEGEFDQMVLERELIRAGLNRQIAAVSIGSSSGARTIRWVTRLSIARTILICFDNDAAGNKAAQFWLAALGRKATRRLPTRKDITEMWQHGDLLVEWVK